MPWVRLEDTMPEDPRWDVIGAAGLGLHVAALAYCNRNLTDGVIPRGRAERLLAIENAGELVEALVAHGVWRDLGGGRLELVDFLVHQPTAETVRAAREAKRRRQERWLAKKRDASQSASRDESVDAAPTPPRPEGRGRGDAAPLPSGRGFVVTMSSDS